MTDHGSPLFVVVPTVFADEPALRECLEALRAQDLPHTTLLVDDGSGRDAAALLARFPEVELLALPNNQGFCAAANAGLRRALERGAAWIFLLNDDAAPEPGCLHELARASRASARAGIAAPLMVDRRGETIEGLGIEVNLIGSGRDQGRGWPLDAIPRLEREVLAATGGALLVRREVLEEVGLFDEGYRFYFEDVDLCLAARDAGWQIVTAPAARVRHRHSASMTAGSPRKAFFLARNQVRLVLKTFPLPHLAYALPLSLGRLGLRVAGSLARGQLAQARAQASAALSLVAQAPAVCADRRPMRPSTFAKVKRRLRWR